MATKLAPATPIDFNKLNNPATYAKPKPPAPVMSPLGSPMAQAPASVQQAAQSSVYKPTAPIAAASGAAQTVKDPFAAYGGKDKYAASQQNRYNEAVSAGNADLTGKLEADAKRAGYALTKPTGGGAATTTPAFDYTADITKQVNDEIAAQIAAFNNQLASYRLEADNAIGANNSYLNEQLGKLNENHAVGTDQSINLNNRRGGFYSGGLDFRLGNLDKGYAEAQGGLQRDIGQRNAEIQAKYGQMANQIADNIQRLQASAPGLIKQRIAEAVESKRKAALEEQEAAIKLADVTGYYDGQPTREYQDQLFNQGLDLSKFELDQTKHNYQVQKDAALNEIKENENMQKQFELLVDTSDKLGYIVPQLAELIGVKPYSNTLSAEKQIVDAMYKAGMLNAAQRNAETARINAQTSQKNAETSRMNAETTRSNVNADNERAKESADQKANKPDPNAVKDQLEADYRGDYAEAVANPARGKKELTDHAEFYIKKYGVSKYNAMLKAVGG